jgi:hypothetical protein
VQHAPFGYSLLAVGNDLVRLVQYPRSSKRESERRNEVENGLQPFFDFEETLKSPVSTYLTSLTTRAKVLRSRP